MVFNKKGFFLDLEEGSNTSSAPAVTVAPVRTEASEDSKPAKSTPAAAASAPASEKPKGPSLTTAEAIAAELAAAEAARPEVTLTTFAPDALQPGNGLRPQRRRQGANLKGFRSMASELFKSSSTGQENSL
jgi:hypothetical protein